MKDRGAFIRTLFMRQAPLNILSQMASIVGPLVCTIIAGDQYGPLGLSTMAVCTPLFFLASFFGMQIVGGAQVVASGLIAKEDAQGVEDVYSAALTLMMLIAVPVCAALLVFRDPIIRLLTSGSSLDAHGYYSYYVLYLPCVMVGYVPMYFCRLLGKPSVAVTMSVLTGAASIGACLILETFMDIESMALGQAIGNILGASAGLFMLRKQVRIRIPKQLFLRQIAKEGSPLGLTRLYLLIASVSLNSILLTHTGTVGLAVYSVMSNTHRFISATVYGVQQTMVPLAGVFHGERDSVSLRQLTRASFLWGNVLTIALSVGFLLCGRLTADLFGLDDFIPEFLWALPFFTAYRVLFLNTSLFTGYYNATGHLYLANLIPPLQELVFVCPLALGLVLLQREWIWAAWPLQGVLTLAVIWGALALIRRKHPECAIPLLIDSAMERRGKYIALSVDCDGESAAAASAQIGAFCDEQGLPARDSLHISMAIEEFAGLIMRSGGQSLSVRVFLQPGETIMRVRWAGKLFDPVEHYRQHIEPDPALASDYLGAKYVIATASDVRYRQVLGVNNLVVTMRGAEAIAPGAIETVAQ